MKKTIMKTLGLTVAALFLIGTIHEVVAADAKKKFAGQVIVLKRIPPAYFNTQNGFVNFLGKNRAKTLYANAENEWEFKAMAFFRKPLGDYEVEMVFFDVGSGRGKGVREFRGSFTQYTQDRNARSLLGRAILTRPTFDANRSYVVEVQSHGKTVASGKFSTKGISQDHLDQQKRIDAQQKEMEKSMEDLKRKAAEQERQQKAKQQEDNKAAGQDLF